jgi:hypothetical protein
MSIEPRWNDIDWVNRRTDHTATLSTTNCTWTEPRANPGFRSDSPTTNRLSMLNCSQETGVGSIQAQNPEAETIFAHAGCGTRWVRNSYWGIPATRLFWRPVPISLQLIYQLRLFPDKILWQFLTSGGLIQAQNQPEEAYSVSTHEKRRSQTKRLFGHSIKISTLIMTM